MTGETFDPCEQPAAPSWETRLLWRLGAVASAGYILWLLAGLI